MSTTYYNTSGVQILESVSGSVPRTGEDVELKQDYEDKEAEVGIHVGVVENVTWKARSNSPVHAVVQVEVNEILDIEKTEDERVREQEQIRRERHQ